jgi:hypothetical protein
MVWPLVIALAGTAASAYLSNKGASKAEQAQLQGQLNAISEQRRQFDIAQGNIEPWLQAGQSALNDLGAFLGIEGYRTPSEIALRQLQSEGGPTREIAELNYQKKNSSGFLIGDVTGVFPGLKRDKKKNKKRLAAAQADQAARQAKLDKEYEQKLAEYNTRIGDLTKLKDEELATFDQGDYVREKLEATPGYQFRLDEGQKRIERSKAARGDLFSGNTLRAIEEFGQNVATDEYEKHVNRLQSLAGAGQTAATNTASLNVQEGNNVANLYGNIGDIRGSSYSTRYGNLANLAGSTAQNLGAYYLSK